MRSVSWTLGTASARLREGPSAHLNFPAIFLSSPLILTATPGQGTKAKMSRLIIKNLPPYLTPDALQKHFNGRASKNAASTSSSSSKIFTLTDVKVAYKPNGTSRRFGFVGFKTEKEAEEARRWFDKSFIDSMRISVEVVDVSLFVFLCQASPSRYLLLADSSSLGN